MADRFAIASGNFNSTAIWSTTPAGVGGASVPTIGDDAIANNRTVTVNVDSVCDFVRNDTKGGATTGGTFTLANGVTLVANVTSGSGAICVTLPVGGINANLIGNIAAGNIAAVQNSSTTGTLSITGNVVGGTGSNIFAVVNNANGVLNLSGNVVGGPGSNGFGVENGLNGIVNIIGNVTGSSISTNSLGARNNSVAGILNIVGNVTGSAAGGLSNITTGTVNITGNVIGGTGSNSHGVTNAGTGFIYVYGTATAGPGSNATGAFNSSTGLIYCTRVVGNTFGLGSVGVASTVGAANTQNGRLYVEQVEFGSRGQTPISGPVYILPSNRNTLTGRLTALGNTVTFYNSLSVEGLLPPVSSVRVGVVYNVGNSVGTMAVPSASAVQFGVPVDNTVGTAALTPQSVWGYSRLSATEVDSMGDRLRNTATTQSVGYQIASFNL